MDFAVVDNPPLPPGQCFFTGTSNGPFIDTGIDIDERPGYGRIYLAVSELSDIAQKLGFAPPEAARRQRDRIAQLEHDLADALQANEGLIAANAALVAAGYTTPDAPLHVPAGSVDDVLVWVAAADLLDEALARGRAAWDAELLETSPRQALLDELAPFINQEAPDGAPAPQ